MERRSRTISRYPPAGTVASDWVKSLRLHPLEDKIIDSACAALRGIDRATLMSEASLFEAARLGIHHGASAPPPLRSAWPYVPERGEEPTSVRLSITLSLATAELVTRAAEYVGTSEPLFIIGATLAYVGRLKAQFQAIHADTPAEGERIRKKLAAIRLPSQYLGRASGSPAA